MAEPIPREKRTSSPSLYPDKPPLTSLKSARTNRLRNRPLPSLIRHHRSKTAPLRDSTASTPRVALAQLVRSHLVADMVWAVVFPEVAVGIGGAVCG